MKNEKSRTLTDRIEKQIYEYIVEKKLVSGDALPKEEELAVILNASRTITREALSRLKAAGVIESKRRRGMVLKKPDIFFGIDKLIKYGVLDDNICENLKQLRIVLEIGLADLIYFNRTPEAVNELKNIALRFTDPKLTLDEHQQLEMDFHSKLLSMSGNYVIEQFQSLLNPFFFDLVKSDYSPDNNECDIHSELAQILQEGSLLQWRKAVHNHMRPYLTKLKKQQ